jgi:hypothetical protein
MLLARTLFAANPELDAEYLGGLMRPRAVYRDASS